MISGWMVENHKSIKRSQAVSTIAKHLKNFLFKDEEDHVHYMPLLPC
jgi:hypothetical protein